MLKQLNEIYNEKGKEFISKLFSLPLIVSEKVTGSFFAFERKNGSLIYYNKAAKLTKIERVVSRYYENPIRYIESLPEDIINQIPEKTKICFQYFPNNAPNFIVYDRVPKNNLLLTHIIVGDDKSVDIDEIQNLGTLLNVSIAPPIFNGYLNDEQKTQIIDYIQTPKEDLVKRFKTESFTKFIISVLNPELKTTFLNDDIDKPIDSIIFMFKNNHKFIYSKLMDPIMDELIDKNRPKEIKDDTISIIYSDMIEFMEIELASVIPVFKSNRYDERYIELMCKLFNKFITKYSDRYADFEIKLPEAIKKIDYDFNPEFISNTKTFELIHQSELYKKLFKLFLNLFKKNKNEKDGLLRSTLVDYQNKLVSKIDNLLMAVREEFEFPTFDEFLDTEYIIDDLLVESNESEVDTSTQYNHMFGFWQNILSKKKQVSEVKERPKVNLIIGNFQPFHNGHLKICESLYKENKCQNIIVQINNNKLSEKRLFNHEKSKYIFEEIVKNHSKIMKKYLIYDKKNLKKILEDLNKKYDVQIISCKENYQNSLLVEADYIVYENMGHKNNLNFKRYTHDEIQSEEYKSEKIRNIIKNGSLVEFKKVMPECLHNHYIKIKEKL